MKAKSEQHAFLSASGAAHWMQCTRAPRWEETLPDLPEQDYAKEGTLAHAIGEVLLKAHLFGKSTRRLTDLRKDPLYTPGMESLVKEKYVNRVVDMVQTLNLAGEAPLVSGLETRVDFSRWVPGGFGTADALFLSNDTIHVVDLKYGKGVPVSATDNPQLRLYALGAYEEFRMYTDVKYAHMVIIQPRLENYSEVKADFGELLEWAENTVKPRAELAYAGEGDWNPSPSACRFCKGRYICVRNAVYQLETGSILEKNPDRNTLSRTEIAGILEKCDQLARWANGMKEYALNEAIEGAAFPGYKLVSSRTNRKIEDEVKAGEILLKAGYKPEDLFELKGITALESAVGKKKLQELLGDQIQKREGRPALVLNTDPRPALEMKTVNEKDYFDD